jgi:hypothetical protein
MNLHTTKRIETEFETLVRPEVKELAIRGKVTYQEYSVPMNSYERMLLYPVLTNEALLQVVTDYNKQIAPLCKFPSTYDEVSLHILLPLVCQRLQQNITTS